MNIFRTRGSQTEFSYRFKKHGKIVKNMGPRLARTALALTFVLGASAAQAQVGPLIIGNSLAAGPIATFDFASGATVGSFVPPQSFNTYNGHGLAVLGDEVYYTHLDQSDRFTDFIHVAPFNGGAGGADTRTLPSPRPGLGIQDLAFSGGVLYALTGWTRGPLQVFGLNPATGVVVSGPVAIAAPASASDGFTVLPNGRFLINNNNYNFTTSCTYNEYDPLTGALIPATTIVVPGGNTCSGVDTDGESLYFQRNFNSIVKTTLAGTFIASASVSAPSPNCPFADCIQDISLAQVSTGRMTGSGGLPAAGFRVTYVFDLHCDPSQDLNNLEVNWDKGNNFHLTSLTSGHCFDTPSTQSKRNAPGFETYAGSGVGLCNGLPAAATWTFTDARERAKNDTATLRITGGCNLSVSGNLRQGNHRYQPH